MKPEWWTLLEMEQNLFTLRQACPTCGAPSGRDCMGTVWGGQLGPGFHGGRRDAARAVWDGLGEWDQPSWLEVMKKERVAAAERERRVEEALTYSQVKRTCPWCGTLFGTVILMEEHEDGCE